MGVHLTPPPPLDVRGLILIKKKGGGAFDAIQELNPYYSGTNASTVLSLATEFWSPAKVIFGQFQFPVLVLLEY